MRTLRSSPDLAAIVGGDIHLPRRYFPDGAGHRVIVGLTPDETSEFEALDRRGSASPPGADEGGATGIGRWQELYAKHAAAWDAWMTASRMEREKSCSSAG
jgi:hypothetical protein